MTDLIELFGHLANDLGVLEVVVHVHGDATLTSGAVDEELDQIQQRHVTILFVRLDPVVNQRLQTKHTRR